MVHIYWSFVSTTNLQGGGQHFAKIFVDSGVVVFNDSNGIWMVLNG